MSSTLRKFEVWEYDRLCEDWMDSDGCIVETDLTWQQATILVKNAPDHLLRVIAELEV